jgi:molecular chaperone GrpE
MTSAAETSATETVSEQAEKAPAEKAEPKEDLADLARRLQQAQDLAEERYDQLMRCRAELDNVIKRASREKEEYARYASQELIGKLLPILDSLEQAARHDQGADLLFRKLCGVLEAEGLASIEALGKRFDPYLHDALFKVESTDLEEDMVAEEIQKGYLLHSRVIRHSKVAVAKKAEK